MKEFLVTMVVFRDTTLEQVSRNLEDTPNQILGENEEMIKFYFHLFDFDSSGAIKLEELKLVIRCFCSEHLESSHSIVPPSEEEIETMFEAMNTKHTNQINFDEFKMFYQRLINESVTS
jgi:Ca2+-binding EF-hand superfamily protein